jgi:hydroxymethylglutaryl-CoA lyase
VSDKSPDIVIQEVVTRDGFQIEPTWVETGDKIRLIDGLSAAGFRRIEVSAFVSQKAIPALRDAAAVFRAVKRQPGTSYSALVPNKKGAEHAIAAQAEEINAVISVSETHSRANTDMTQEQALKSTFEVVELARSANVTVNVSIATAFGCPFEGPQPLRKVLGLVEKFVSGGADGITLADTTDVANPRQVTHRSLRA